MNYMKRFIVFTDEDLEKIKSGEPVPVCSVPFSEEPYDVYCVSEEWMKNYDDPINDIIDAT